MKRMACLLMCVMLGASPGIASYDPGLNTIVIGALDWCSTVRVQAADTKVPPEGALWLGGAEW